MSYWCTGNLEEKFYLDAKFWPTSYVNTPQNKNCIKIKTIFFTINYYLPFKQTKYILCKKY